MKFYLIKVLFLLMFCFSTNELSAQEISNGDTIYSIVPEMPEYPGGTESLFNYLSKGIKYPVISRETDFTGKIYITFVVDTNGKVINPKILRSPNKSMDEDLLRLVENMPLWSPGKMNGRPAKVRYNMPMYICFK